MNLLSADMTQWLVAAALTASLASACIALLADRWPWLMRMAVFPLLALSGTASVGSGIAMLSGASGFAWIAPLGLPWLRWHLSLDPLGGFFLGVIGVVVIAVSFFGPGYVRHYRHGPYSLAILGVATGLFIAGMQLVVVSGDAFSFMIAWELMSVSSYLLVAYEHKESASRRAAFIYLLMAEAGAGLILLAFGVLVAFSGGFTFEAFRSVSLSPVWSNIAFALALVGFGMKAGLVPVHVWLPDAHPAAPAHISALMSGVMLKVAVYGFIRFGFDLLGQPHWTWGVVLLVAGSVSALYGVLYALMQHDLKRLLAYHSVENIGIIFIGLGLAALFDGLGFKRLAALGLVAALYHTLNHAVFKSLLFLGAGVVSQRGHERNLEHMGGLIWRMPWTAAFFLVGCISISALPPFNGFASEWLTLQTALQAPRLSSGVLRALVPVSAAMLALTGALAAACFVKVYGIAFLGQARSRRIRHAREAGSGMVIAQGLLAVLCLLLGVLPTPLVSALGHVTLGLTGESLTAAGRQGWLWLTPVSPSVASYSAPVIFAGVAIALCIWALVWLALSGRRRSTPVVRSAAWDCGFGPLSSRMQYSATAFSMPLREIFQPVFRIEKHSVREMHEALPTMPTRLELQIHVEDICWNWCYRPIERGVNSVARLVARIQTGHLRHYLAYSFFTLIVLLWLVI